jgi:oligopeptide transport system substrate-binding protein
MTLRRWLFPLLVLCIATACQQRPDKGAVVVSAIGGRPSYADVNKRSIDTAQRLLLDSTAQGLVRFDAAGQIEPGLAERWIVIDAGRTYIFRLREAEWRDGAKVTAADVATILKRAIAPGSRNPLKPFLSAIDDIAVMTDAVIEVRLSRPRPDLLKLFAQPELSILRANPIGGSGPFRITDTRGTGILLSPADDPVRSPDDDERRSSPEQDVRLIGESAARALIRFAAKQSDYVAGGTVDDYPLLARTQIAPANIKVEPAAGLFGLAIVNRDGVLASAAGRAAIAQAIDRTALIDAITADWGSPVERLLPDKLDSASPPAIPSWTTLTPDARLAAARAEVGRYRATSKAPPMVRIALPTGPGGTLLYGQIAARLVLIGVQSERVAMNAAADLRLIDAVAPYDSARWYLATACIACSDEARAALEAARDAPDMTSRGQHIAEADGLMASDVAFIPLATPLRWSLVAVRLRQWQGNARGWHPLNHLRADTN